jgi:hypothetical protein
MQPLLARGADTEGLKVDFLLGWASLDSRGEIWGQDDLGGHYPEVVEWRKLHVDMDVVVHRNVAGPLDLRLRLGVVDLLIVDRIFPSRVFQRVVLRTRVLFHVLDYFV